MRGCEQQPAAVLCVRDTEQAPWNRQAVVCFAYHPTKHALLLIVRRSEDDPSQPAVQAADLVILFSLDRGGKTRRIEAFITAAKVELFCAQGSCWQWAKITQTETSV